MYKVCVHHLQWCLHLLPYPPECHDYHIEQCVQMSDTLSLWHCARVYLQCVGKTWGLLVPKIMPCTFAWPDPLSGKICELLFLWKMPLSRDKPLGPGPMKILTFVSLWFSLSMGRSLTSSAVGCEVVLSSSWRRYWLVDSFGRLGMCHTSILS